MRLHEDIRQAAVSEGLRIWFQDSSHICLASQYWLLIGSCSSWLYTHTTNKHICLIELIECPHNMVTQVLQSEWGGICNAFYNITWGATLSFSQRSTGLQVSSINVERTPLGQRYQQARVFKGHLWGQLFQLFLWSFCLKCFPPRCQHSSRPYFFQVSAQNSPYSRGFRSTLSYDGIPPTILSLFLLLVCFIFP